MPNPEKPIKVVYVVPGVDNGISMVFAFDEISALCRAGVDGKTFLFSSSLNPRRAVADVFRLAAFVRRERPDLVHAQYGTLTALVAGLVSSRPLVITYRGSDLNPAPSETRVRDAAQKALSQISSLRARAIICVSEQLRARLWWAGSRATVIPSGIDLSLFQPLAKATARAKLGWDPDERVVFFNEGRRPGVKRTDLAEAAVAVAKRLIGEVRLVVMRGDIPHVDVPLYLNASDCLLMCSDFEGSPNIVKEALACNLPVVSVAVGDVVERSRGVSPGCIVERDPAALGAALAGVLAAGRRSNGRPSIEALASSEVTQRILGVYENALRRENRSAQESTAGRS